MSLDFPDYLRGPGGLEVKMIHTIFDFSCYRVLIHVMPYQRFKLHAMLT